MGNGSSSSGGSSSGSCGSGGYSGRTVSSYSSNTSYSSRSSAPSNSNNSNKCSASYNFSSPAQNNTPYNTPNNTPNNTSRSNFVPMPKSKPTPSNNSLNRSNLTKSQPINIKNNNDNYSHLTSTILDLATKNNTNVNPNGLKIPKNAPAVSEYTKQKCISGCNAHQLDTQKEIKRTFCADDEQMYHNLNANMKKGIECRKDCDRLDN